MTTKNEQVTRVDHSQYDRPLATASENKPVPTKPECHECGSSRVEHHKMWKGDLLPMCRPCFEAYMTRGRR